MSGPDLARGIALSALATLTCMPFAFGRYFDTGSYSRMRPSSTSIIAATEVNGLVMEYRRKIASFVIGAPDSGSRWP